MGLVIKAANEGKFLLQSELHPLLSYAAEVTKGAVRKSLEALEEQGMLVREKAPGNHRELVPTEKGYDWFRPAR